MNHVDRSPGTDALGQNVADACQFQNRTDSAAGDNAGTFCGRFQEHFTCDINACDSMWDRGAIVYQRNSEQILLGIFTGLLNCIRNFVSLSCAVAYAAFFVTNDNQGGKAETTSTFNNLGYTVDDNNAFFKFFIAFNSSWFTFHSASPPRISVRPLWQLRPGPGHVRDKHNLHGQIQH